MLCSVIEYTHDQAQRPGTRSLHSYANCGWHYAHHNKESGGVVYLERINELLNCYAVNLRLGSKGPEKGRLIRHGDFRLDEFVEEVADACAETDEGKTASAIRLYRSRSSTVHDQRAAVAQLAGTLEKRRREFRMGEFAKGDEAALFNIFHNFPIRQDNQRQNATMG